MTTSASGAVIACALVAFAEGSSAHANPIFGITTDTPLNYLSTIGDAAPPPYTGSLLLPNATLYTFPFAPIGVNWTGSITVSFINGNNLFGVADVVRSRAASPTPSRTARPPIRPPSTST
ncbi:MAG: hypothetical protein H7Y88_00415 [Phycisphaerales bacterium]|nr:hypothetical protein [Phycisphaerales bacterium]